MRFQVPQFIEHEPKVVGPFTFRQFIYLGVPATIAFVLYFLAPFFIFLFAAIFLGSLGFLFAFIKLGGRSLPTILANFFRFSVSPKTYIWKKGVRIEAPKEREEQLPAQPKTKQVQLVQKSKIKDLATRIETNK